MVLNQKLKLFVLDRKNHIRALLQREENVQNLFICIAALISGILAVCYANLFKKCETIFESLYQGHEQYVFLWTPLFFLLAWIVIYYLAPGAAGSGIPQVMAANELEDNHENRIILRRLLSAKIIAYKILSSTLCLIGGGAIGREGPTLQVSASVFYMIGDWGKRFLPKTRTHLWIVSGASAGLAAAFNTPLGGIVYAIEELGAAHFHRIRTGLLMAIIISGLVAQSVLGDYLYLGFPKVATRGFEFLPEAVGVGLLSGAAGAIFSALLFTLNKMRRGIKKPFVLAIIAVACGLVVASLIYNIERSSGSGIKAINDFLFHEKAAEFKLVLSRFFGTMFSYLCGAAGGIFSPSLAIGASIGSFIAHEIGSTNSILFVLMGMIGFLTGVTRTPFTSFILVVEMTNRHTSIFPMMISALAGLAGAKLVGGDSFYERMKKEYLEEMK